MLDERELVDALEIQERSYLLLLWVRDGIERGFLPIRRAHEYSSRTAAAEQWLTDNYLNLPEEARPAKSSGPELQRYARFFASYLRASFELEPQPRARLVSICGCYCPLCADLVAASHLKTKKLTSADKRRAENLKLAYLQSLAHEERVAVSREQLAAVLDDRELARTLALATYGRDLLHRVQGQGLASPATLVLWRAFAWKPTGSPLPGFRLRSGDVVGAERAVRAALLDLAKSSKPA